MARPRKPSHLKVVSGTDRKDRRNDAEPVAPRGAPEAPLWLSNRAAEIFAGLCATIDGMGYLSTADQAVIAMAASRLEEVEIATARVEDEGRTYDTTSATGDRMIRPNPMVAQRSEAMRHAHALLSELGLTPAARSKVSAGKKNDENPFKALMGG
ncbi:MAG: phage terminase small subunit P27 family [Bosea sp.]|uniref:phage terminase small subunit P27 family n=1 Tax=Bosea sp. (in: a-proteobacteria) TaxID=1871050 RepID=UPI001AC075E1|nr:phage terminase small subunit P27 family [Bosea sp. (in: a-proteobacteria)]MBN9472279.1 phage terminase small subunit P27 family [Bosea sp. (in: a-proteobacteria)]